MNAADAAALVGHVPLWLVDPPEPVRVLNPRQKGGRASLARAGAAGQPAQGAQRAKRGLRIVTHGGPWKLVDPTPLATGDPLQRDYYQVEAEDGRAYLIYWDRVSDSWFLQGIFD